MAKTNLTPEYLHQLFSYDPHDGLLYRKERRNSQTPIGSIAGYLSNNGYICVGIDWKYYKAHRIIWAMTTGAWPKGQIDHINGIRSDNRLCNLRDASKSLNAQNLRRPRKDNRLGLLGVHKQRNSFIADISIDGKGIYLGSFATPELAHVAYLEAKRKLHPGGTL